MDYPFSASILEKAEALLLCTLVNFEGKENFVAPRRYKSALKERVSPNAVGKGCCALGVRAKVSCDRVFASEPGQTMFHRLVEENVNRAQQTEASREAFPSGRRLRRQRPAGIDPAAPL